MYDFGCNSSFKWRKRYQSNIRYNKSKILAALASGIKDIVQGKKNHTLIYTIDLTTIIIDEDNNFLTAYKTSKYQYKVKKIKELNGGR